MSTVQPQTIIRETAESSIPRTAKSGRISASLFMADLFIAKTGCEAPNAMVNLTPKDGMDLIHAVADALGVRVSVVEPATAVTR